VPGVGHSLIDSLCGGYRDFIGLKRGLLIADWEAGRLCTAEGVGSSPIGSTRKCANLQVKLKIPKMATELIRSFVLQPYCSAPSKAQATSDRNRAVRAVFRGSVRASNPVVVPLFFLAQLAATQGTPALLADAGENLSPIHRPPVPWCSETDITLGADRSRSRKNLALHSVPTL
jgi:hypothetical protein